MKESLTIEFKSSFNDGVIETLSAFANTRGGKVLVGLNDKGMPVKGFTLGRETLQKWMNEVKTKTQPSIIPDANIIEIEGSSIAELCVSEFPLKPVSFKGRYFKRVENSNHQLALNEISDLHLKSFHSSWDSYISPIYSYEIISENKVARFVAKCNYERETPISDDVKKVLHKFELINKFGITNACRLLFCQNDMTDTTIELGRFSTPTSIKDGITLRCDLFSQVEIVLEFIKKHINKQYIITGDPSRKERWQYPLPALREIVINMIVHRDYMHNGDSSIKIFDEWIEFFNPGRLPDSITVEMLQSGNYVSNARNKKIASVFKEAQLIEKYGSGIRRIQEGFSKHGLPIPLFENFQHGFRVVVQTSSGKVRGKVREKVRGKSKLLFKRTLK